MISKNYLKPQHSVLKHRKQTKFVTRKNKYLTDIVMQLIRTNEYMKQDMKLTIIDKPIINVEDNMYSVLLVLVITFCFLRGVKHLHKISMNNTFQIESYFDLKKMIYSAIIIQFIYISVYLRYKFNKKNLKRI